MILLLLMILFPGVLLGYIFITRKNIVALINTKNGTVVRRAGEECIVRFQNKAVLPVVDIRFCVDYKYNNCEEKHRINLQTYVPRLDKKDIGVKLVLEHVGVASIGIAECRIWDPCGLFSIGLKLPDRFKMVVYPVKTEPDYMTIYTATESQTADSYYSQSVSGDDTSEIFDIREYKTGDVMSRIHWKLTAKSDTLLVKDYSFPIGSTSLVLVDVPRADTGEKRFDVDGIYEFVYAIGNLACYRGKEIVIAFFNSNADEIEIALVADHDKLEEVVENMITLEYDGKTTVLDYFLESELTQIPRLIYVTSGIDERILDYARMALNQEVYIYNIVANGKVSVEPEGEHIYTIDRDEINQGLHRVVI